MENKIAVWENEFAKFTNKIRKQALGKGAKKKEVRICGSTIFIKEECEYTPLEIHLIRHIQMDVKSELECYRSILDQANALWREHVSEICPSLDILDVHMKIDLNHNCNYIAMQLNRDLEKMIKDGTCRCKFK